MEYYNELIEDLSKDFGITAKALDKVVASIANDKSELRQTDVERAFISVPRNVDFFIIRSIAKKVFKNDNSIKSDRNSRTHTKFCVKEVYTYKAIIFIYYLHLYTESLKQHDKGFLTGLK